MLDVFSGVSECAGFAQCPTQHMGHLETSLSRQSIALVLTTKQ